MGDRRSDSRAVPGPRFAHDLERVPAGLVGGADEAGRGCLAGPLVAAAVSFDYRLWTETDFATLATIDDSKKLSRTARAGLYGEILTRALQVVIVSCSAGTIDARGLHVCNLAALRRCVELLRPVPETVFVDGFRLGAGAPAHEALVGGDGRSAAVAAASIVAKVTRDRAMAVAHERWPQYGFDGHVGYASRRHQEAIVAHGVCELHRLSFASVAYQQLGLEA